MVWDAAMPATDEVPDATPLGPQHAAALELATLTRPGPFGPRILELGEYFGCFVYTRLAAVAGERMHARRYRETSGVCTHPDFQSRGLARRHMVKLIRRQMMRENFPFLHVMCGNSRAHQLYGRRGFRNHSEPRVRIISRD
jgi:GNAT superfamily N-acetyltransferase